MSAMFFLATLAVQLTGSLAYAPPRPHFSWETLPVFFHSSNTSGPWSDAAVKQIARYPMATNEKSHAMRLPGGGSQSEEIAGPAACRQVDSHKTGSDTFFYLNSVIDWPFNFKLHGLMKANPSWRLKNRTGGDLGPPGSGGSASGSASPGGNWLYNLTNTDMRAAWIATCVAAARDGCTGCFIDQVGYYDAYMYIYIKATPHIKFHFQFSSVQFPLSREVNAMPSKLYGRNASLTDHLC